MPLVRHTTNRTHNARLSVSFRVSVLCVLICVSFLIQVLGIRIAFPLLFHNCGPHAASVSVNVKQAKLIAPWAYCCFHFDFLLLLFDIRPG